MQVTVITPAYNSAQFIAETISSVISQTFRDWEMIIIDDNSQDNTKEIISKLIENEDRIKYIRLNKNVGAAEARNIGLRMSKGRYIAFIDSDDIWYPEKLEKQLIFMKENNIDFSFTSYDVIDIKGKYIRRINVPKQVKYYDYLKNTIIGCLTVVIDKNKIGYFEFPLIRSSHDMALWLQIMRTRSLNAFGMPESLAKYRLVPHSNTAQKYKAALDVWQVYRKNEKKSLILSAYNFLGYAINAIIKRI